MNLKVESTEEQIEIKGRDTQRSESTKHVSRPHYILRYLNESQAQARPVALHSESAVRTAKLLASDMYTDTCHLDVH